jgi:hypothetical protein
MPSRTIAAEEQYADLPQQGDTAQLGMWVFITTETLFFGALLFTCFLYRMTYPHQFAEAAKDTVLWCGSVNIGLIMTSSRRWCWRSIPPPTVAAVRWFIGCLPPPFSASAFSGSKATNTASTITTT